MMSLPMGAKLLVGIDFSDDCERALRHAITLAERNQAQLELLHVVEWQSRPEDGNFASSALPSFSPGKAQADEARSCLGQLGQFCSHLVADRVPAEVRVLIGDPAGALLETARQTRAVAIVLGAQGRRMSSRRAVGSTAARVCAASSVPVLLASCPEWPEEQSLPAVSFSSQTPSVWTCGRCGREQQAGTSSAICAHCWDPSRTWVAVPRSMECFTSVQAAW